MVWRRTNYTAAKIALLQPRDGNGVVEVTRRYNKDKKAPVSVQGSRLTKYNEVTKSRGNSKVSKQREWKVQHSRIE